jgi:hypothetical protein
MKTIIKFVTPLCLFLLVFACDDMNSLHQEDIDRGETIYTGKVDSVKSFPGNNRIRFSWLVDSDPRITKTVIYWNGGRDSLVAPLNRAEVDTVTVSVETAIPEGSYTFEFVTKDDNGHRSLKVEHSTVVYGEQYAASLPNRNIPAMTLSEGPTLKITWSPVETDAALYTVLKYTDYTNPANPVRQTRRIENEETETILENIRLEPFLVTTTYKPEGGLDLIDALEREYIPYITEKDILLANGFTEFTAAKSIVLTKLTYPVHVGSFLDLFYFPNLHELDLTGTNIPLTTQAYSRNNVYGEVGGGDWSPFVRKAGNLSAANIQIVKDMLESGQLTKIRYVPNSLGLDELFAPYISSGIVELVNLPDEVLVPHQFYINGVVESTNFSADIVFPATDAPAGAGLQNIYKLTMLARAGSLAFSLPAEYQINMNEYKYLKFKVYAPGAEMFQGSYDPFRRVYLRFMNYLWGIPDSNGFGQELWNSDVEANKLSDDQLQKWVDITIDLANALNRHNRVILFTMGAEANATFPTTPDMVFYFANIRLTKQ